MSGVAIVSGGGRGIGAAICLKLAERFRAVGIIDRDRDPAEQVAAELRAVGSVSEVRAVDVTDVEAVGHAVDSLVAAMGGLDTVVAAAGNMVGADLADMSVAAWSSVLDVHLTGSFALAKASLPALRRSSNPSVVLVSSIAARGIAGHANYGAAKAGIMGLTRSLARELGPEGIRVNAVAPGFIDTRMTRDGAVERGLGWEEFAGRAAAASALGRIGQPEEIAAVVDFLAGPDSSYMTGQIVYATGGT
ncbi:MAG: SDR family NAD(P)-dependent oxidoreductase [bacterium]|nr:SDR family NAD(P)-dependent oxidoreductase [bacterium]